ncbi:hypothetical protein B0H13DRAFT_1606518 [Mycena leptocephala]|nr:hypothetical protein B0H13DRAFT_1606518 [Mycena leptocephala]
MTSQSDFPTAAEGARAIFFPLFLVPDNSFSGCSPAQSKPTLLIGALRPRKLGACASVGAANQQARMEEADTFRGVHLDPNAHHWDEMEEDDDNFLDGVIEFGDGRQYKIESADLPTDLSSATLATAESASSISSPPRNVSRSASRLDEASNVPVSKEERFADDDFDRSWLALVPRPLSPPRSTRGKYVGIGRSPSPVSPRFPWPPAGHSHPAPYCQRAFK